jgi:hypothetical protein
LIETVWMDVLRSVAGLPHHNAAPAAAAHADWVKAA